MAWHVTRTSQPGLVQQDLGLMSAVPAAPPPATGDAAVPSATSPAVPSAPAQPADAAAQPSQTHSQPPEQAQPVPQGDCATSIPPVSARHTHRLDTSSPEPL